MSTTAILEPKITSTQEDVLDGDPIFPGFRLALADLFQVIESA